MKKTRYYQFALLCARFYLLRFKTTLDRWGRFDYQVNKYYANYVSSSKGRYVDYDKFRGIVANILTSGGLNK